MLVVNVHHQYDLPVVVGLLVKGVLSPASVYVLYTYSACIVVVYEILVDFEEIFAGTSEF